MVEIPSHTIRVFVDALERLGYVIDPLLERVGLRRADLAEPDGRVACASLPEILAAAMQQRPLKNPGARLAAVTPVGAFPLVDYLVVTSESVGAALRQLSRYLRLSEAPYGLELKTSEDPIRVLFDRPVDGFAAEFGVALTVLHLTKEADGRLKVVLAGFRHSPDDPHEIERLLGCRVVSNASWNGFELTRETWNLPMRRRDAVLRGVLEEHAAGILLALPAANTFARQVRDALLARMAHGEASLERVARTLATSTRSLQRRLSEAGLTYQGLLEDARRGAAQVYLSDSNLSVADVAYLLGYSEPAAFHRAFKRWHGETPQEFRKHGANPAR